MNHKPSYVVYSNPNAQDGDLQVLFAGKSQTAPAHEIGPRVYDYYLVHYIVSGNGEFTCQGESHALSSGDSFIIEPETLVTYRADALMPWKYCWVAFQGSRSAELLNQAGISPRKPIVHGASNSPLHAIDGIFRRMFRALHESSAGTHLRTLGELHQLFAYYAELRRPERNMKRRDSETRAEQQVRQAIHYLTTQYSEPITIESMAESLGYNRAYLSKVFKDHTGLNPVSFLRQTRINKARLMLREKQGLTIEQIAFSVGFTDPLYFSKQFKQMYGMSPSQYRQSLRSR